MNDGIMREKETQNFQFIPIFIYKFWIDSQKEC